MHDNNDAHRAHYGTNSKSMDPFKSALKSTEELVTQARLNQIAKDHQSIGTVLDNRCLFDIEEPKRIVTRKNQRKEEEDYLKELKKKL